MTNDEPTPIGNGLYAYRGVLIGPSHAFKALDAESAKEHLSLSCKDLLDDEDRARLRALNAATVGELQGYRLVGTASDSKLVTFEEAVVMIRQAFSNDSLTGEG